MKLIVNGEDKQIKDNISVAEALKELNFTGNHLAVAVNHTCVPRSQFTNRLLNEGDDLEILAPMSGG